MTGGPWEITDDPSNPWGVSQEELDAVDNPEHITLMQGLGRATDLGFPLGDARYERIRGAIERDEELEDDDADDLINWLTEHDDQGGYRWVYEGDGFSLYPISYLADL